VAVDAKKQSRAIGEEVASLKDVAHAFERWHQDMNALMDQNRKMRATGEELSLIVRHLTMLSLNAKIEAARAGDASRGFVVVATEMRTLSDRADALQKQFSAGLHRNDLSTTATFQDIQASGKMMLAAISGLEAMVGRLQGELEETPA
jgi:methyl-accepting chemotaxis protein